MKSASAAVPKHRVVRTIPDLEGLRTVWETNELTSVDADLDYFSAVVELSTEADHPHVIHLHGPNLDSLLVARVARQRLRVWSAALGLRSLVISFDGVLGAPGAEAATQLRDELLVSLRSDDATAAIAQKVDVDSDWFETLTDLPSRRRAVRRRVPHWRTDLPDSYTALLAQRSTKSRRQLRYDDNRLRRTYGDRLVLRRLHEAEHHHRLRDDIAEVAAQSYQGQLGIGVNSDPVQRALLDRARDAGWLRAWMLYVDDRPVAFWWGIVRSGILSIGSPGFAPAYAADRVGYFTLRRMLEDSCADPEIGVVDWGPGHADYKQRFGTSKRTVADVVVTDDDPRGWALTALLHSEERSMSLAREMSGRLELARRRRRRLVTAGKQ